MPETNASEIQRKWGLSFGTAARAAWMGAYLEAWGIPFEIISGYRSTAKQAALYAARDTTSNPVAAPGSSLHERGLAFDATYPKEFWPYVAALAYYGGLRWGGTFKKPDPNHFDNPGNL